MKIVIECREDSELEIVIRCNKVDDNIKKIISLLEDNKFIIGKLNNRSYQIMVNDIYYIEANEDRVFLYCKDKVYETNSRLYELENELETCSFIRISKSILLNLNKLLKPTPLIFLSYIPANVIDLLRSFLLIFIVLW